MTGVPEPAGWDELLLAERLTSQRLLARHVELEGERDVLQARLDELERSRDQLQSYAEDLRRTYAELRRSNAELERWLASLNVLHDASTSISGALDEELVLRRVISSIGQLVRHNSAQIYLADEQGALTCWVHEGSLAPVEMGERAAEELTELGRHLASVVARQDEGARASAIVLDQAALLAPLRSRGRTTGLLALFRGEDRPFGEDEARLVELLASVAAVALENARLYQQTERLATVDPLTDLYNYRYFHQSLALEVARAKRHEYPLGVLMADLDHFKQVNDRYGHPKGDEVLREVAHAAQSQLRRTDVLARLGGEEFGVLLPGATAAAVSLVGEKLRTAIARLRVPAGGSTPPIRATMSVGGVSLPAGRADARLLIDLADQALFRAKQGGRNRVVIERAEEG